MNMGSATLLVVDDERDTLTLLRMTLERAGYEVITAASGQEAISLMEKQSQRFDLIILDLMMPVHSGFDVLQAVRVGMRTPPVIVLSAKSSFDDQLKAREMGAIDYLTKPTNRKTLLSAVENALAQVI